MTAEFEKRPIPVGFSKRKDRTRSLLSSALSDLSEGDALFVIFNDSETAIQASNLSAKGRAAFPDRKWHTSIRRDEGGIYLWWTPKEQS